MSPLGTIALATVNALCLICLLLLERCCRQILARTKELEIDLAATKKDLHNGLDTAQYAVGLLITRVEALEDADAQ